jgi:hypothetical protein
MMNIRWLPLGHLRDDQLYKATDGTTHAFAVLRFMNLALHRHGLRGHLDGAFVSRFVMRRR